MHKTFFCLSLLLHGLLLAYLTIHFLPIPAITSQGKAYVKTYMQDEIAVSRAANETSEKKPETAVLKKYDTPIKTAQPEKKQSQNRSAASNRYLPAPASLSKVSHERAILKLLHQAISAQQTYPETALALQQKGTVKIGFLLFPDGKLQAITLLKSSGFDDIDSAALAAVTHISPVKTIHHLLKKPERFSVDIVFE